MMFIYHLPPPQYSQNLHNRNKQGKVAELKIELNNSGGKKDKNFLGKKVALKKIVANMTMSNNDMVALFAEIIQCMSIPNLEIKKMYVVSDRKGAKWLKDKQVLPIPGELCQDEAGHCIERIAHSNTGVFLSR